MGELLRHRDHPRWVPNSHSFVSAGGGELLRAGMGGKAPDLRIRSHALEMTLNDGLGNIALLVQLDNISASCAHKECASFADVN